MFRLTAFSLSFLFLFACGKDEPFVPTEEDQAWPDYAFTDALEPKLETEIPRDEWETTTLPMNIVGDDNGDTGILYSLALGHYFLVNNQRPSGDYLYEWFADIDEEVDSSSRLQMHAVAWSQVLLYRFIERDAHLIAAYRVAKKYIDDIRLDDADGTMLASLGGATNSTAFNFFLLVELEDVMGEGEFEEVLSQMANFFEAQVDDDGCIYQSYPHSEPCKDTKLNAFGVGQAMVAMERLYRKSGDEKWLDLLEKSANYYYELNDGAANSEGGFFWSAWAGPPMVSLVLERPDPTIEAWIFKQADRWVSDQYTPGDQASRVGGFRKLSGGYPVWNAASEVEIIVDAFRLAEAREDTERMARYKASSLLAAQFLMSLQYREGNVEELANPARAIGAYHFSKSDKASSNVSQYHVRADYMDHIAITMLKMITYLDLPETYPGDGFATLEK